VSDMGAVKCSLFLRTLDWTVEPGALKNQDFFYPIFSVRSSNLRGSDVTWEWMKKNFDKVYSRVSKASPSLLQSAVSACAGGAYSFERADEVEAFLYGEPSRKAKVELITRGISQVSLIWGD
jgi:hypothetical protein